MHTAGAVGDGVYVSVASVDVSGRLRAIALDLVGRLVERPEVAGVVLLGGLAAGGRRQFVDARSDVDLAVFLDLELDPGLLARPPAEFAREVQPFLPTWLPNFKFTVPPEAAVTGWPVAVDNHQHVLAYEEQDHIRWDLAKQEAFAETSEIVHDPHGRVARLIRDRTRWEDSGLEQFLLRLFSYGRVLVDGAIEQCVFRGQFEAAHDQLGELLRDVMAAWFVADHRFPPVIKWRVASLGSLGWLPPRALERYRELQLVRSFDAEDVRRRCAGVRALLDDTEEHLRRTWPQWPADAYTHAVSRVFRDRQLREVTTADALDGIAGLSQNQRMDVPEWNWANWRLEG